MSYHTEFWQPLRCRRAGFAGFARFASTTIAGLALAFPPIGGRAAYAQAAPVSLGQASRFAVLAGTTVTNTGTTVIDGDVGVSPGTSITGFESVVINGSIRTNDGITQQAQSDLTSAYDIIAGESPTSLLTGQDLGGLTLMPGVYRFADSAQLSGLLTLDAGGDPNARFDFQIGSTLTTASSSSVLLINSGGGSASNNVFFQVGSSATLGTNTSFLGNILALTSITFTTGATNVDGRALARNGAVTLDTNTIRIPAANIIAAPEPGTLALLGMGMLLPVAGKFQRRRRARKP